MKKNNLIKIKKGSISIFQIIVFIMSIIATAYLISDVDFAKADDNEDSPTFGCCEKTIDGRSCAWELTEICLTTDNPNIDSIITELGLTEEDLVKFTSGTKCEQTTYCDSVCVKNVETQQCSVMPRTKYNEVSNDYSLVGTSSSCKSFPACKQICCFLGNDAFPTSQGDCQSKGGEVQSDIDPEECAAYGYDKMDGCCILDEQQQCLQTTSSICARMEGDFIALKKCNDNSDPAIESRCGMCRAGYSNKCLKDEAGRLTDYDVWNIDACGNKLYKTKDCPEGQICYEDKITGEADCKALTCEVDGKIYQHGESWCGYDSPSVGLGRDLPGSWHWLHTCNFGVHNVVPCGLQKSEVGRDEICVDLNKNEGDRIAACKINPTWTCLTITDEQECVNSNGCYWFDFDYAIEFPDGSTSNLKPLSGSVDTMGLNPGDIPGFDYTRCLPVVPTGNIMPNAASETPAEDSGNEKDNAIDNAKCSYGSASCVAVFKKSGKWKLAKKMTEKYGTKNAYDICFPDKKEKKFSSLEEITPKKEWIQLLLDRCVAIGDCGVKDSHAGDSSGDFKGIIKITTAKSEEDQTESQHSISEIVTLPDVYPSNLGFPTPIVENPGEGNTGPDIEQVSLEKTFDNSDSLFYQAPSSFGQAFGQVEIIAGPISAILGALAAAIPPAALVLWIIAAAVQVIALLVALGMWIFSVEYVGVAVTFNCNSWEPPQSSNNCEKCQEYAEKGGGYCTQYLCHSIGMNCDFNDQESLNPEDWICYDACASDTGQRPSISQWNYILIRDATGYGTKMIRNEENEPIQDRTINIEDSIGVGSTITIELKEVTQEKKVRCIVEPSTISFPPWDENTATGLFLRNPKITLTPMNKEENSFNIWCEDLCQNRMKDTEPIKIKLNNLIDKDLTPPVIVKTNLDDETKHETTVPASLTSIPVTIFVNEPIQYIPKEECNGICETTMLDCKDSCFYNEETDEEPEDGKDRCDNLPSKPSTNLEKQEKNCCTSCNDYYTSCLNQCTNDCLDENGNQIEDCAGSCAWDYEDKAFSQMTGKLNCPSINSPIIENCGFGICYTCDTIIGDLGIEEKTVYFKCKDAKDNVGSAYSLTFKRGDSLFIEDIQVTLNEKETQTIELTGDAKKEQNKNVIADYTVKGGKSLGDVKLDIDVLTSGGADNGVSNCELNNEEFLLTGGANHNTELLLTSTATYNIKCIDSIGNVALTTLKLTLDRDGTNPEIIRYFNDGSGFRVKINEPAVCVASPYTGDPLKDLGCPTSSKFDMVAKMSSSDNIEHSQSWDYDKYDVICRDIWNNIMSTCKTVQKDEQ